MRNYNYELFDYINLKDETSNDGRRIYITPDGVRLPSVTTVLSDKLPKKALENWRKRVGEAEADRVSTKAKIRGSALHKICENYILGVEKYTQGSMPTTVIMFNSLKPYLSSDRLTKIYGVEVPLYSYKRWTAGRSDLIGQYEGVNSIIDFKSSTRIKDESWIENYFLQATCYALLSEEMFGIDIPQIVVMIGVDNEPTPQLFVKNKADYVERVLELYTPPDNAQELLDYAKESQKA